MNKRKILTLAMTLCMVAILAIGGTLAYFTDTDADVNVMTAGNVYIVQNETDRYGKAYVDGQTLLPAVYVDADGKPYNPATIWEGPKVAYDTTSYKGPNGGAIGIHDKGLMNEIDKIVSVTNKGNQAAYVRTIVLMEDTEDHALWNPLHYTCVNGDGQGLVFLNEQVEIDGTTYQIGVGTYKTALQPGQTSAPSLKQIWLDPSVGNEWYDMLGEDGTYCIIAFSQAVQSVGFADATTALNTAFGEVTAANVAEWVATTSIKTTGRFNVVGGAN